MRGYRWGCRTYYPSLSICGQHGLLESSPLWGGERSFCLSCRGLRAPKDDLEPVPTLHVAALNTPPLKTALPSGPLNAAALPPGPVACFLVTGAPGGTPCPSASGASCSRLVRGLLHLLRVAWLPGRLQPPLLADSLTPTAASEQPGKGEVGSHDFLKSRTSLKELRCFNMPRGEALCTKPTFVGRGLSAS